MIIIRYRETILNALIPQKQFKKIIFIHIGTIFIIIVHINIKYLVFKLAVMVIVVTLVTIIAMMIVMIIIMGGRQEEYLTGPCKN